jgi:Glycosyl transferase family 2
MSVVYDIVVPTSGRPSLARLLHALSRTKGPRPQHIVVVDDRPSNHGSLLPNGFPAALQELVVLVRGPAAGPAAARNVGWRQCTAEWTVFLDDDVIPSEHWAGALIDDIAGLPPEVAGSQAVIEVPLPEDRPPTDWERNVAGLEKARYVTADMAYRRASLEEVGGFDERFPRPYREDADIALRVMRAGYRLASGTRRSVHPVGPTSLFRSVRLQAGNADDVLMAALHGPCWRERAGVRGRRLRRHLLCTGAGVASVLALARGRRRTGLAGGGAWLGLTLLFACERIAPGPRTAEEMAAMLASSAFIPPAATYHWLRGWVRLPGLVRAGGPRRADWLPARTASPPGRRVAAVGA